MISVFYHQYHSFVVIPDEPIPVTCYCEDHDCPHYVPGTEMNGTCILPLGAQCFSSIEETSDEEPIRRFGCLPPDESSDMQVLKLSYKNNTLGPWFVCFLGSLGKARRSTLVF